MRYILGLIWIAFTAYALFFAPGNSPANDPIFKELLRMRSEEPWVLTVFSWLGIFPAVYACMLLRKPVKTREGRHIPAWPFVLFSFGLGAFALLPYFALSSPLGKGISADSLSSLKQSKSGISRVASHRLTHLILLLLTLGAALYALLLGNPERFEQTFNESSFVHIMTIDFVVLTLLSTIATFRDAKVNGRASNWAWAGLLPLAGPILYLLTERK
ncbi:hypothetical protein [Paenibacillus sp. FSL R7-0652]|uniref:DUF2834 domain-containing protein n=1 Tax=Paenibacillus sp. AN1007 TaxID=3151385 RepID=A0AAU8N5W2_9BACL